ncbi:MAG: TlpA disulfide reductase family protein [Myxococcales bacterium]|nr:TlpA family protein disulfide reductase [Myxococcota bacterium]MDW8283998.1 TlpA disulfide reductase family protein [Myxococcales bacterium]
MTAPLPPGRRALAYGAAGLAMGVLVVHFLFSLPDALTRGREGVRRSREAPCQVLRPTPWNPVLGRLPQPAPDFQLPMHDGQPLRLSQLRGRVVLLNFWATWCSTCIVEMPSLERLAERMQGRPFTLLAVSVDESWDKVRAFFPQGTPMTVLLDSSKGRDIPSRYGTEKFPESFLIDPDGIIRYYIVSERRNWHSGEVRACIEALLD